MKLIENSIAINYNNTNVKEVNENIIKDKTIKIEINGEKYGTFAVIDDSLKEFAIGYIFGEGLVHSLDELESIDISNEKIAISIKNLNKKVITSKSYENITATGITFEYTPQGYPHGLCSAEKFIYVTTSGGGIGPFNFGFDYIKIMAEGMYGIKEVKEYRAENLDVIGNDPEAILQAAIDGIE